MAKTRWGSDWKVGLRVWIERKGDAVLGEGRAELLAAIDREKSITKAARDVGMSYRRAWNLIQAINSSAGETLVEAAVGGRTGGGAKLTELGRAALAVYEQLRSSLVDASAGALQRAVDSGESRDACVHLAAAVSLQEAVNQILAEYALVRPSVRVRAIFGASNELADHLLAGAPGDLFISAEPSHLDRLKAAELLESRAKFDIARNGLAIVGGERAGLIKKPHDLLQSRFQRIALAEPACPLGQYSRVYLQRRGIYDELLPKVLHVDNSRAVLAAVVSGAASAGVSFASDAASSGAWRTLFRVPAKEAATNYSAALISRGKMRGEAKLLLEFLGSAAASRCLRRCGLQPARLKTERGSPKPPRKKVRRAALSPRSAS